MSDPNGPVRRRRIAGENKPAAPAAKPVVPKVPARKAAAKKAALQKAAPPAAPPARTVASPKTRPAKTAAPAADADSGSGSDLDLRRLLPAMLLALVAIVAGVLLTVMGVQNVRGEGGNEALETSREQAVSAASTAATTIFSFSSDQLDEHVSASKALMTPSFAKDFDKVAPALTEVTANRRIVVKAEALEAAPLACGDECSPSKVNVLVFLDQARLVGAAKQPTVFANRISVSMVKSDDGWLVDNIRAL
ncbi:hypothetical protein [Aeromicrobium sp. NPDC092404]|uniref:hypothetical protein n=1 Tax=Aeromicrobium sp. NPDC092404 TaxID=3154976 RepID=UPI003422F0BA